MMIANKQTRLVYGWEHRPQSKMGYAGNTYPINFACYIPWDTWTYLWEFIYDDSDKDTSGNSDFTLVMRDIWDYRHDIIYQSIAW